MHVNLMVTCLWLGQRPRYCRVIRFKFQTDFSYRCGIKEQQAFSPAAFPTEGSNREVSDARNPGWCLLCRSALLLIPDTYGILNSNHLLVCRASLTLLLLGPFLASQPMSAASISASPVVLLTTSLLRVLISCLGAFALEEAQE
jgi:hypothetical protein